METTINTVAVKILPKEQTLGALTIPKKVLCEMADNVTLNVSLHTYKTYVVYFKHKNLFLFKKKKSKYVTSKLLWHLRI